MLYLIILRVLKKCYSRTMKYYHSESLYLPCDKNMIQCYYFLLFDNKEIWEAHIDKKSVIDCKLLKRIIMIFMFVAATIYHVLISAALLG